MQRLHARGHVDDLALTPGAAATIEERPQGLSIGSAATLLEKYWQRDGRLLVVGAVGAVTRLVAPLLTSKLEDPAVLVLDARGDQIIPLLGGHQAGAEELALAIAADLGGTAVLTGDCANQGRLALDLFGHAWGWQRSGAPEDWHQLMLRQSQGSLIQARQESGSTLWRGTSAARKSLAESSEEPQQEAIHLHIGPELNSRCCWHPPSLWIGLGCERNTSLSLLERALANSLAQAHLAEQAVAGLASIEQKSDEPALIALAQKRGWPLRFFKAEALNSVSVPTPSSVVAKEMGTASVAEASALLASGEAGKLLSHKQICKPTPQERGAVTIAIAAASEPFAPGQGELHLVGSGPGDLALLTPDARNALARSVAWVGYGLYLDLLEPLRRPDQARLSGELTREKDRCLQALKLAQQGARVALISSGDSGIYGMAGLALELWLNELPQARPHFQVHPGVSALQLAAARVGAPLMHDFCTVSLSDRLTPWPTIASRLRSAATGDFVVALYNPRSKDRDWQLQHALKVFLEHRPPTTPVALARQLGRRDEHVEVHTLAS
ncbi:MAG: cobalamin biosynthesis protein, partial [Prochlorococcus sp.]